MIIEDILNQLQALGQESVRKRNLKHGSGTNQFGVKLGDIRLFAHKIKTNHEAALALWNTGNVDARLLAILLIDPSKLTREVLTHWVQSEKFPQIADWLYAYLIKDFPEHESLRNVWMHTEDEMCARAGWSLTAGRIARKPEGLDIPGLLDRIEAEMATAPAPVQWTMNGALAQIGIHFPVYRERAIRIGEQLGLYKDYPVSKGCTSPFAPIWIHEMVKRKS